MNTLLNPPIPQAKLPSLGIAVRINNKGDGILHSLPTTGEITTTIPARELEDFAYHLDNLLGNTR